MRGNEWMMRANCAGVDPEIMFPQTKKMADIAKKVCADCPVQWQCRDRAIELISSGTEISGIWAGQHASELLRFKPDEKFTDRVCEWPACTNMIPDRKYTKGGNVQKFCSSGCRVRMGKRRDYERRCERKLAEKTSA